LVSSRIMSSRTKRSSEPNDSIPTAWGKQFWSPLQTRSTTSCWHGISMRTCSSRNISPQSPKRKRREMSDFCILFGRICLVYTSHLSYNAKQLFVFA
jgi:hypothetical protein